MSLYAGSKYILWSYYCGHDFCRPIALAIAGGSGAEQWLKLMFIMGGDVAAIHHMIAHDHKLCFCWCVTIHNLNIDWISTASGLRAT